MRTFFQAIRLIAITLWVGGLAFFAFVLAPIAFSRLPTPRLAGMVVGGTLSVLHWIGLMAGLLFVLATAATALRSKWRRATQAQVLLIAAMFLATAFSQFHILPAMERDRAQAGGDIESALRDSLERRDFDRLHALSEKLEGIVLLSGLGVLWLMAQEQANLAHVTAS